MLSQPAYQPQPNVQTSGYDQLLVWLTLALLTISLIMVYSSSIAIAESHGYSGSHYLIRQTVYIAIGVAAAYAVYQVPIDLWQKFAPHLFLFGIFLLILVLIPGVGRNINGSQRWLGLFVMNLQPSELMKLFTAMYVADYAVRKSADMDSIVRGFLPMVIVMLLVGLLLIKEPDFGAFVVTMAIAISILWLGGISYKIFIGISLAVPLAFYYLITEEAYRLARVVSFINPWDDPYASDYQLAHSLMAFGRGEWMGTGLGASIEKLLYLPEAHTDFLLAVTAEELGFLGVATVLGLFACLVMRGFKIGKEAIGNERYFSALLAQGLTVWIGVQTFINVGVNMGVLPTKGLTLPLMSYGGSGILANCIAIGLLLSIDRENRLMHKGLPL